MKANNFLMDRSGLSDAPFLTIPVSLGQCCSVGNRFEVPQDGNKARGSVNDSSARASKKVGLLAQFTLVPNKASAMAEQG